MKIIGNIVSDKIIDFDPRIKTVGSINEIVDGLPTLIIGLNKAKDLFPNRIDILNKKIDNNNFWTFSFIEKRSEYEVDIDIFIQYCYENMVSDIEYIFIDPVQYKLSSIKKIINKIKSSEHHIPFIYHNHIYLYVDNIIFGIDLILLETFFNISKDSIKNKIKSLSGGLFLDDVILIKYKDYLDRLNSPKFIPYLYTIENE